MRALIHLFSIALFALLLCGTGSAVSADNEEKSFAEAKFPGLDSLSDKEGAPPVRTARVGGQIAGYIFHSKDILPSAGFAGRPIDILVALKTDGRIAGAKLIEHHEPILMIGVAPEALARFVDAYAGTDIREPVRIQPLAGERPTFDAISGATISSLAFNDTIMKASRAVASSRGILTDTGAKSGLDLDRFEALDWPSLLSANLVTQNILTIGAVREKFRQAGQKDELPIAADVSSDATFLKINLAIATPAMIGRNLLGQSEYIATVSGLAAGQHIIAFATEGLYSIRGPNWRKSGAFDRIQIVQNDQTITLRAVDFRAVSRFVASGAPDFGEFGIFVLPRTPALDPAKPWRMDVRIDAPGANDTNISVVHSITVPPPQALLLNEISSTQSTQSDLPLWQQVWWARAWRIGILIACLSVLSGLLVFQDSVARRPKLWFRVRIAFGAFTLLWLGAYAAAQLSVVNVLTFGNSLLTKFEWEFFLLDPLIFILWSYVAVVMLFWGRGVFCGWLCPFGQLQELLNRIARILHVPQINIPFGLHERLWPVKYIVFLAIFALSLGSVTQALLAAEIEPFKTAISLRFLREFPFVAYTLVLLGIGLVIERFFCRYLCPLGAALAIPARIRMFDWLKRRKQCGFECQVCAHRCPVQAIHPDGRINPNECIHCLRCQTNYFDDHLCPPLILRRKRRETGVQRRKEAGVPEPEQIA